MKLEIEKMLIINSGHVTKEDMDSLCDPDLNTYPYTRLPTEYGVIVYLTSDMELPARTNSIDFITEGSSPSWCKAFSEEFIEILRIAKENDCHYVNFDCDGTEVPELPRFDW